MGSLIKRQGGGVSEVGFTVVQGRTVPIVGSITKAQGGGILGLLYNGYCDSCSE